MRIPGTQEVYRHTLALEPQLTLPEHRVRFSPGLVHYHGGPRHPGTQAFQTLLTDHYQEIDVESGPRLTPHTQSPGADQCVRHSRSPEAVRGPAQSAQQVMT